MTRAVAWGSAVPDSARDDACRRLAFDRPLSAASLAKQTVEQVFVTDYAAGPEGAICSVAAQLPLTHARFSDVASPLHDPTVVAEAVRQAGVVAAQHALDVPAEWTFLLREMHLELSIDALTRVRGNTDLVIVVGAGTDLRRRQGGRTAGARMLAGLALSGNACGCVSLYGAWLPADIYASLRGAAASRVPAASCLGEAPEPLSGTSPRNTVITQLRATAAGGYEASLRVDPQDTAFFDPPVDHVPGLLLLDAMKQAAIAAVCRHCREEGARVVVTGFSLSFSRFAEHGTRTACRARVEADQTVAVGCHQQKRCCGGTISYTVLDAG